MKIAICFLIKITFLVLIFVFSHYYFKYVLTFFMTFTVCVSMCTVCHTACAIREQLLSWFCPLRGQTQVLRP